MVKQRLHNDCVILASLGLNPIPFPRTPMIRTHDVDSRYFR